MKKIAAVESPAVASSNKLFKFTKLICKHIKKINAVGSSWDNKIYEKKSRTKYN
jgi:hypothetical protein